jgi:hypothetical protein
VLIGCCLERREGQDSFEVIKVAATRADGIVGTRKAHDNAVLPERVFKEPESCQ